MADNKLTKQKYKCSIMGCEFKTRAKDPRCPTCLSRMVKPVTNPKPLHATL